MWLIISSLSQSTPFFTSFFHRVSWWSSEVIRTLLRILADLKHAMVCIQLQETLLHVFGDCSLHVNNNWYHTDLYVSKLFSYLLHNPSVCQSFRFLSFSLLSLRQKQDCVAEKTFPSFKLTLGLYFWPGNFIILLLVGFTLQRKSMVFHKRVSVNNSHQVFRTFLSILVDLNIAVIWMVSIRPPTSKSFSPFSYPLLTVPKAPITIGTFVTCMLYIFFNSLARWSYFSFFSHSFSFQFRDSKIDNFASSLFFLSIIIKSGLLAEIRWSACISKSHGSLCVSFSRTGVGFYYYYYYY